ARIVPFVVKKTNANNRLHLTGTPLRSVPAGEAHVLQLAGRGPWRPQIFTNHTDCSASARFDKLRPSFPQITVQALFLTFSSKLSSKWQQATMKALD
ncbi:MAG: hypothetical protein C4519_15080, partial [Desulfobacteraceae bacterium]